MAQVWIEEISISDFGPFYGDHTFNFTPLDGKSGVLIGGRNGAGKTHLLRALYLAVVGESGVGDLRRVETGSDATRFNFDKVLNRRALEEGRDKVRLSATVQLRDDESGGSKKVEFTREIRFRPNSAPVWKSVAIRSETAGQVEDEATIQKLRDAFLPRHLARFFFFDAERSQSINLGQQDIIEGITRILGLWTYSELETDLRQLISTKIPRVFSKTGGPDPETRLINISADVMKNEGYVKTRRRELESVERDLVEKDAELLEIEDDLRTLGAVDPEELAKAQLKRDQIGPARTALERKLVESWEHALPLALLGDFKYQLNSYLISEERRRDWEGAKSAVEPKIPQVKSDVFESPPDSFVMPDDLLSFYMNRLDVALNKLFNPPPEGIPDSTFVVERNEISIRVRTILEAPSPYLNELSGMVYDIDRMDAELRELDQKLKQMQQNAAAFKRGSELHEKRGQVLSQRESMQKRLDELQAEIPRLEHELAELKREETNQQAIVEHAQRGETLALLAMKYREAAGEVRLRAATDLRRSISDLVGQLWIEITGQYQEFIGVEFDSHWHCWLVKTDGSRVSWDEVNTSAGQRQVRMLAFYEALRRLARLVPPLVVDTPLARLDKRVRASVIEKLYLSGHQSAILTTDSEIDPDGTLFEQIRPKIARAYTLYPYGEQDSKDYRVTVKADYFGKDI